MTGAAAAAVRRRGSGRRELMMFALPVDGPATDRHSSCVVYVSCNGPGVGTEGAPRTDKERCMKRRPKVLFHASVGWMDRGSHCFGDFSPPEISSEFSGKSLIFLRPRERSIVLRSGKLFLFFCPRGRGHVSPLPRPDATRKKVGRLLHRGIFSS